MARARRELTVGDCLDAVSRIESDSVAMVYLDPPFNSGRTYDLVDAERNGEASDGRTEAFEDQWRWTTDTERDLSELPSLVPRSLADLVESLVRALGRRNLAAYLVAMAPRLFQLHRVLDERGSLYLHCDTTASHYLRVVLDEIFGPGQFRNEIVWRRTHAHSSSRRYGPVHDVLLFFSKSQRYRWNTIYTAYPSRYLEQYYTHEDEHGSYQLITCTAPGDRTGTKAHYEWSGRLPPPGRHWAWKKEQMEAFEREGRLSYSANGTPRLKRYADEAPGVQIQDVWTDIGRPRRSTATSSCWRSPTSSEARSRPSGTSGIQQPQRLQPSGRRRSTGSRAQTFRTCAPTQNSSRSAPPSPGRGRPRSGARRPGGEAALRRTRPSLLDLDFRKRAAEPCSEHAPPGVTAERAGSAFDPRQPEVGAAGNAALARVALQVQQRIAERLGVVLRLHD